MKSLAQKIAFKFSFVLALLVTMLSVLLFSVVGASVRKMTDREIKDALERVLQAVKADESLYVTENELPYYITYTVYDADTKEIAATNAPFIHILPPAEKKPIAYREKEFFTDGVTVENSSRYSVVSCTLCCRSL